MILYFDVNKVLRQASHRKVCHSDSALGFRTVGVWMWIGIADRNSGKASGMGCPDLPVLRIGGFGNQSYRLPTNFQQTSSLALQLGKICFDPHRLVRDPLVVNLC